VQGKTEQGGKMIEPKLSKGLVERIVWEMDEPTTGWLGGSKDTIHRITQEMVESKKSNGTGKTFPRYRLWLSERHGFRVISTMHEWNSFKEKPCMYRLSLRRLIAAYDNEVKKLERDRQFRIKRGLEDELRAWAND